MKNCKPVRYIIVKDGQIDVRYTSNFIQLIKDEFQYFFDSTDYLFDDYPDVRVFVKDESLFTERPSVFYYYDHELFTTFNGTVFFAKLGTYKPRSLSKREVAFLLKNLKPRDDGNFDIDNCAAAAKSRPYRLS